jgi:nucleotide-binding universal stress UspA family protein
MAVPATAHFRPVQQICLASDLRHVSDKFPVAALQALIQATGATLHVVNVDNHNEQFRPETPLESSALHQLLAELRPQYHYETGTSTEEAVHEFLDKTNMDWLIVTPHRHSFFEGLFHKSQTKALMRLTDIPVVALHEEA